MTVDRSRIESEIGKLELNRPDRGFFIGVTQPGDRGAVAPTGNQDLGQKPEVDMEMGFASRPQHQLRPAARYFHARLYASPGDRAKAHQVHAGLRDQVADHQRTAITFRAPVADRDFEAANIENRTDSELFFFRSLDPKSVGPAAGAVAARKVLPDRRSPGSRHRRYGRLSRRLDRRRHNRQSARWWAVRSPAAPASKHCPAGHQGRVCLLLPRRGVAPRCAG